MERGNLDLLILALVGAAALIYEERSVEGRSGYPAPLDPTRPHITLRIPRLVRVGFILGFAAAF